jgi:hypothetical protein
MANFSQEDFEKFRREQEKVNSIVNDIGKSMKDFISAQGDSIKMTKLLIDAQSKLNGLKGEEAEITAEIQDLFNQRLTASDAEKAKIKTQIRLLSARRKELKKQIPLHEELIKKYKEQDKLIKKGTLSVKALAKAVTNDLGRGLKDNFKWFLEQDKAVRSTQLSMGILSNQSKAFSQNIYKASVRTQILGVSAKDLAEIQKDYSEDIGRSVVLSQQGLEAMAEMAKGTTLNAEGAAQLAANMENFGISAEGARDIVQETVDAAHRMGVNASKVTKNMLNNMKMAQKYHFKGGVRGMIDMATRAAKFRLDMEAIAGFADQLFTPEGAIDAAAQLQVLGGEWAKLADPFSLMYQARHDIDALHKSVIEATKGTAQFNKETGEFEISGMELHRLREVAKATGMDFESLAESAKEAAKYTEIKSRIRADIDPKYHDFLTSVATYNEKKGQYFLEINGDTKAISDLTAASESQLKALVEQKETLKTRAKEAQSFDEIWKNLKDTFRSTLLPFLKGVELGLREPLNKFIKWMETKDIAANIAKFAEKIGDFATSIGKWVAENPVKSLLTAVGGIGLFEAGKWYLNGLILSQGFNAGASVGGTGGGTGGGMLGGLKGRLAKTTRATRMGKGLSGKLGGFGKGLAGKGLGLGLATGLGGMALDYGRSQMDDPYSTTGKAMGVGSSALYGAGLGATIGSIIPGIGTAVGGLIGAGGGALYGLIQESMKQNPALGQTAMQDFVMRPGEKAQPFSSNDTLVGLKAGGPIEKGFDKGLTTTTAKDITVNFKPIKVEFGTLTLKTDNSEVKLDLNEDPILAREIASIVQQELRKSLGGGKLNPNPVN